MEKFKSSYFYEFEYCADLESFRRMPSMGSGCGLDHKSMKQA